MDIPVENSNESASALPKNQPHNVEPSPVRARKPINMEVFEEPLNPIEPVIDNIVHVAK